MDMYISYDMLRYLRGGHSQHLRHLLVQQPMLLLHLRYPRFMYCQRHCRYIDPFMRKDME